MKRIYILLICCSIFVLGIASCKAMEKSKNNVIYKTKSNDIVNSTVVIDDLELQVPSLWTIQGNVMLFENMPVLKVEINDFDENNLKQAFQYKSTEECVSSFLPNGVYLQSDNAKVREINDFSIYEFVCTADKYSKMEDMFVKSEDIVYLEYVISPNKNKIYCLYFMHDMAKSDKIITFLKNIQIAKNNRENIDREYRWMIDW